MVLEVDLDDLVAQPEHNCMLCAHPFLHVNAARRWFVNLVQILVVFFFSNLERSTLLRSAGLQIGLEVLKQRDFLLKLLREVGEEIFLKDVLFLSLRDSLTFVIVEAVAFVLNDDFC